MRVVVLAPSRLSQFAQQALAPLLASARHQVVAMAIDCCPPAPLRRRLTDNLRRGRGGYVLVMAATLPWRRHVP